MIIDAHVHLYPRAILPDDVVRSYMEPIRKAREQYGDEIGDFLDFYLDDDSPFSDYTLDVNELLKTMNTNRIDYSVVLGLDFELVNEKRMTNEEYMEWLFGECSVDDRLLPFIAVDPNRGDEGLKMIERFVKRYDTKGIKMYPATGFYPDEAKYDRYWDLVDDLGLIVVTHAGVAFAPMDEKFCHPVNMCRVAEMHPDSKYIIAHMGGKFSDELPQVMRDHENIYTDCSAMQGWLPGESGVVVEKMSSFLNEFPDRVVFGSDFPLYEMRYSEMQFIRLIMESPIGTGAMKEALMGNNMARILGL